jgi:hypothetical protein
MTPDADAIAFFAPLSAHSDVASELFAAIERLGDKEVRTAPRAFGAMTVLTEGIVFCGAAGMSDTFFRLRPADVATALATGAQRCEIGPEWVRIALFRNDWPKPDLGFWALRAYDFAKTGK